MTHERFRSVVLIAACALSLAAFTGWPGPPPAGPGGWLVRLAAAFGLPAAAWTLTWLFGRMRRRGPFRADIERFGRTFDLVLDAVVSFVVALHAAVMAYVLSGRIWLGTVVVLFAGAAILFVGNLLPTVRPASVIGVRTPWTLRDEGVWRRTHRLGGYVAVLAGLGLMAAAVFSFQSAWAVLAAGAAALCLGLPAASYLIWRRRPAAQPGPNE